MEDQIENLEEARKIIKSLRERYRAQSHQLLAWRRRVKAQVYYSLEKYIIHKNNSNPLILIDIINNQTLFTGL